MSDPLFSGRARRAAPFGLIASVIVLALAASACGGSSGSSAAAGSTSGTTGTSATAQSREALAACLKQHGVTLPGRRAGGNGGGQQPPTTTTDRSKLQAAFQAYGGGRGFGSGFGNRGQSGAGFQQAASRYAQCMRKQGISDFPDPKAGGGRPGDIFPGYGPGSAKAKDPKVQAAEIQCRSVLRPAGGFRGTPPGTTQSS
jgi:hypothetical protein